LPLVWTGQLVLKNDVAAVKMHYVSGNQDLVRASLPPEALTQDGSSTNLSQLRISQRMRLDPLHLDQVAERMQVTHNTTDVRIVLLLKWLVLCCISIENTVLPLIPLADSIKSNN